MPACVVNGNKFIVHWEPEHDIIVLVVSIRFRASNGTVQWAKARSEGYLDKIPESVSGKDLSHRLYHLLHQKYNKDFRQKVYEKSKRYASENKQRSYECRKKRKALFDQLPDKVKLEQGYKTKRVWSQEAQELLVGLAEEYRVSEKKIDWKKLMLDQRVSEFPYTKLSRVRSYYWQVLSKTDPDNVKQRRAYSLKWKKEHPDRVKRNDNRRKKAIKETVNEHLKSALTN